MKGFKAMLSEHLEYDKLQLDIFHSDNIFETLRVYAGVIGADILAMLERKEKSNIKKWFRRDLVKKMEALGNIPLLSFNKSLL
ncbi:MAG: hypothetical protein HKN90_08255 [Flavobacteriaceae bacterium]|nr:hypothetical protein [Flavobacteriaceae bacterium]